MHPLRPVPALRLCASLLAGACAVLGAGAALPPPPETPAQNEAFVTREGDRLLENGRPFRFLSWNVPNLHIVEDPSWVMREFAGGEGSPVYWHRVTAAEQEDAVDAVTRMGGRVIRTYTLSIQGGRNNRAGPSHYMGPDVPLNEELMRDYDRMIAACGRHGVRLILPIIDEWDWFGGIHEFAALSGGGDFFTTRQVIDDYKALLRRILTRVNTVNGLAYRDDPTILAWETGNELQKVPAAWTAEIAACMKETAPRQLVADGANGSLASADDPNVDLLTGHYYEFSGADYVACLQRDLARVAGRKAFFIGEFGLTNTAMEVRTMDATISSGAVGALLWSLRFHSADGGFYWHRDGPTASAYHWPGFASNAASDERAVLAAVRERSWAIRGFAAPPIAPPAAPRLLESSTPGRLVWWGSAGAERYVLQRSAGGAAWTDVSDRLDDSGDPFVPFADTGAPMGVALHYRLKAVNAGGDSPFSPELSLAAVGPEHAVPANDPRIAVMGRTYWDGRARQMGFPGIVLRVRYRGPAPTFAFTATTDDCYFNLSVNGWDPVAIRLRRGHSTVTLPSGAAPAEGWTVEFARRTEAWQGTVAFEGVRLPEGSELLPPPAWPERRLLVIGDSTTTGEYVERLPPSYDATARSFDATRSYAALLGRWLGAQTQLVAYGGEGLIRDWAGKPTDHLLPRIYNRTLPDRENPVWNPADFPADAVMVNVGTDSDHGMPMDAELIEAYVRFVERIRGDYPRAAIVVCQNSHQAMDSPERAQLFRVLQAVKASRQKAGDARVWIARAGHYPGTADDRHIVAFQQEELAQEILPVLRQATGW